MEAKDRIIVALDVPTRQQAYLLVDQLAPYVGMFKVGSELFTAEGPQVVRGIHSIGGKVFLDLKFHDIPNTVAGASRAVTRLGVRMFNVHCSGGFAMMRASFEAADAEARVLGVVRPIILGVTVLTSTTADDLKQEGTAPSYADGGFVARVAGNRGHIAQAAHLDGVVASPLEIITLRERCGTKFMLVITGIRPAGSAKGDQERVGTPGQAISDGADYLVIGRPITQAPDPVAAAQAIAEEIAAATATRK